MGVTSLTAGLYLVATPIGAARDITLRALDILSNADVLAAEDTRNTRRLLDIHGVKLEGRPLVPYHDHNGGAMRPRLLADLAAGKTVAYVSDAGTPMVADPGFALARDVIGAGYKVFAAPGASALLAALCVAGLPSDRFFFAGFAPNRSQARIGFFRDVATVPSTLVFYESPKRLEASLTAMCEVFGGERQVAVCRELTKKFEEVRRGTLSEVLATYDGSPIKGEVVIVVGPPVAVAVEEADVDAALVKAMETMRVKDAANTVAETLGIPKREAYARALELK